jgi:hypothetical protein
MPEKLSVSCCFLGDLLKHLWLPTLLKGGPLEEKEEEKKEADRTYYLPRR